jgi:hypothetical protein
MRVCPDGVLGGEDLWRRRESPQCRAVSHGRTSGQQRAKPANFRVARYPAGALKGGPKMSVNAARPGRIYRSDQNVGPNNLPGQCPTWRLRVRVDHFRLPTMRTGSRQQPCPVLPTIQEQKCSDFRYLSFSGSNLPPPYSLSAGSHIIGPARLNLCISGLFRVCSRSLPASFP